MAQIDVFQRERGLAKKAQRATSAQPTQTAPQPTAPDNGPSLYDEATTDFANWLRPQQGTINTQPRNVGAPQMPMEHLQANPAFKPKSKLRNVIYGW